MTKFSANLGCLWQELPLVERVHAASKAGFSAVECHWPYDTPPGLVREALLDTGLPMLALNTSPGDLESGEFGLAAVPGRRDDALAAIDQALEYAVAVGAKNIHVMAGVAGDGKDAMSIYLDNLAYASDQAGQHRIGILIEAINRIDRPGYTLHTVAGGIDVIEQLHREHGEDIAGNVRFMFDCYHVQMTEGNLAGRLRDCLDMVGHVQIAAVPGRAEPDRGEINYPWLLGFLDDRGYRGHVGAEYIPAGATDEGLHWLSDFRNRERAASSATQFVYRGLDQDQLDAEYNNSAKVADAADQIAWYTAASERYRKDATARLDVAYGSAEAEKLDLFYPNGIGGGSNRPVHVFFHGGYWRALGKGDFSYVAHGLRDTDAICAIVDYALIPSVDMDELVAQCRRSLAWLWNNANEYGGDPASITISGHSAGGHLVAMMMAADWPDTDSRCPPNLVRAGISLSGLMDLEPIRLCYLNETLAMDDAMARRNSPLHAEKRNAGELACYVGETEGVEYCRQSDELARQWSETTSRHLPDHHHFSIVRELYDADSFLCGEIRRIMGLQS